MMKQIMKNMLAALKTPRKMLQTWPGQVDKNFQGGTQLLSTIAARIKIFGGTIFFLTGPVVHPHGLTRLEKCQL